MRKRKLEDGGDGMEPKTTPKVARTMPGTKNDDLLDGTTSSGVKLLFMGAKSSLEREPDDDGWKGASNWEGIELIKGMRRQSLGESLGNKDTDENHTNTQA